MNAVQHAVDVALHPRCITYRTVPRMIALLVFAVSLSILLVLLVGHWWVIPIVCVLSASFVVHPGCLLTGHQHKHRKLWL